MIPLHVAFFVIAFGGAWGENLYIVAEARQVGEENFYSNMTLAGAPKLIELAAEGSVIGF
jgi:hypothetical protein